jgi:hypothetical protein
MRAAATTDGSSVAIGTRKAPAIDGEIAGHADRNGQYAEGVLDHSVRLAERQSRFGPEGVQHGAVETGSFDEKIMPSIDVQIPELQPARRDHRQTFLDVRSPAQDAISKSDAAPCAT